MPQSIFGFFSTSTATTSLVRGVSSIPSDVLVIAGLFVILFVYGVYAGRSRLVSLVLALYPAAFVWSFFPFVKQVTVLHGDRLATINVLVVFVLFVIFFDIIIGRHSFAETAGRSFKFFRIAGYAIAGVVFMIFLSQTILDVASLHVFSPAITDLFSTPTRIFIWTLVAPVILCFL